MWPQVEELGPLERFISEVAVNHHRTYQHLRNSSTHFPLHGIEDAPDPTALLANFEALIQALTGLSESSPFPTDMVRVDGFLNC